MRIKILAAFFITAAAAFGSDCDGSFQLDSTHLTVQFNNQSRACVNWQISYFSSGFSAVSVQFESAPNGTNGNVPGTWAAFAGTLIGGSNPNTATTQATSTFSGSFPWVRIRLVSFSGTGTITGRMLGAQLTSATSLPSAFFPPVLGSYIPPNDADFSFADQGNATRTVQADGITLNIPTSSASDNISKYCAALPVTPWTVTTAYVASPSSQGAQYQFGLSVDSPVVTPTYRTEWAVGTWATDSPRYQGLAVFTSNLFASAAYDFNNTTGRYAPISWERVRDTGAARFWEQSYNGRDWFLISNYQKPPFYPEVIATRACMTIYESDNNFSANVKYIHWRICPNGTGTAC